MWSMSLKLNKGNVFRSLYRHTGSINRRQRSSLASTLRKQAPIDIHPEVEEALARGAPVVALESTIISHGMPYPTSLETAQSLEKIVRSSGSVPATVAVIGGRIKIGLQPSELERIADTTTNPGVIKLSRRDIAPAIAMNMDGATTCSATLIFAALAGIKVFATGGLGGVHRGGENSMDISADLQELTRYPVGLVSAGVKSILDIGRTLEYMETLGVPVLSYSETNDFPGFYSARSGFKTPWNVSDPKTAASILFTQSTLGMCNGVLYAVPIPKEYEATGQTIQQAVEQAVSEAEENGIHSRGKEVTPWLLKRVGELTAGRSLANNVALVQNTARVGGQIAVEYAKLVRQAITQDDYYYAVTSNILPSSLHDANQTTPKAESPASLIVVGCAALDITSQPRLNPNLDPSLGLHSTSPGTVSISLGGVGRNISEAAHRILSSQTTNLSSSSMLLSLVGNDSFGRLLLDETRTLGMRTDGLITADGKRSAVCNMLVDGSGNLKEGVADMDIIQSLDGEVAVRYLETHKPKIVAVDGNLSVIALQAVVGHCSQNHIDLFFEPTSVVKSTSILSAIANYKDLRRAPVTFASPNLLELARIYHEARSPHLDLMSHESWWNVIDGFALGSKFRRDLERLARINVSDRDPTKGTLHFLVGEGIAQMAVNLLPFFGKIVVKCGERGILVAMRMDDSTLEKSTWASVISRMEDRCVVSRSSSSREVVVLQHFPALYLDETSIVNVTGAGDSLVGSLLATLVCKPNAFERPESLSEMVNNAQQAAVLTLQSSRAVSSLLSMMSSGAKCVELY